MNSPIGLLSFGLVEVKPIYEALLTRAYEGIRRSQRSKTATFWQKLENELLETPHPTYANGLKDLGNYFDLDEFPDHHDPEFEAYKVELARKLTAAQQISVTSDQVTLIVKLLKTEGAVNRQDLPDRLLALGCRRKFIQAWFPWTKNQKNSGPTPTS